MRKKLQMVKFQQWRINGDREVFFSESLGYYCFISNTGLVEAPVLLLLC